MEYGWDYWSGGLDHPFFGVEVTKIDFAGGPHRTSTRTVETAYKVAICPRGNLLYMWIYLITEGQPHSVMLNASAL